MGWLENYFGISKPIIGMAHFGPLPGDPRFITEKGVDFLTENLLADIHALQTGGINGIMLSNEGSQPWTTKSELIPVACMASIIGRIRKSIHVPFGVHVIWDPIATIQLAISTGADFAWEVFTGVFASDFGLWNTEVGRYIRLLHNYQGQRLHLLSEFVPEAAAYLGNRPIEDIVCSTIFNTKTDAICIAGLNPGVAVSIEMITAVKKIFPDISVLASTGVRIENINDQLKSADGAIVGTDLKKERNLWNPVDIDRVNSFMQAVDRVRKQPH